MQDSFTNIPYTPSTERDPLREFDLYLPPVADEGTEDTVAGRGLARPLLCFVHGGAWRSEDKSDHSVLARNLSTYTNFSVVVPNYRLTTEGNDFRHPGHAADILEFLTFVLTWAGPQGRGPVYYDAQRIYLMGHSCSAHMLACIFLDSSSISPSLTPSPPLLKAVQAIVMSEGIYDLDRLLSDFPKYREWFIAPTFGVIQSFAAFSTTGYPLRRPGFRWLLIHSRGDSLINEAQPQFMYQHLQELTKPFASTQVQINFHELDGEHNDILKEGKFVAIAGKFVLDDYHKDGNQ